MPAAISILVVDDDAHIRQTLAFILKQAGYSVTSSDDPHEALRILQAGPFDLIFLDLKMPQMSGIELLAKIRVLDEEVPVFILTGHATLSTAIEAMRQGASDYFIKPVKPQEILERVEAALDKIRQQRRRNEIESQIGSLLNELRGYDKDDAPPAKNGLSNQTAPLGDPARLLQRGPFVVDLLGRQAMRDQHLLQLSPTAFDYLVALLRRSPAAVSYEDLVREVQGYDVSRNEARDIARWQIYQLRQSVEPDPENPVYILNVRGHGYRIVTPGPSINFELRIWNCEFFEGVRGLDTGHCSSVLGRAPCLLDQRDRGVRLAGGSRYDKDRTSCLLDQRVGCMLLDRRGGGFVFCFRLKTKRNEYMVGLRPGV